MRNCTRFILLFSILCYNQTFCLELAFKSQSRLIKALLEKSGKSWNKHTLAIVGIDPKKCKNLQDELARINHLNIKRQKVPFTSIIFKNLTELENNGQFKPDSLYLFDDTSEIKSDKIIFTTKEELLDKGALICLTRQGTVPKVFVSFERLKELKIKYPTTLMKLITLRKGAQ